MSTFDSLGEYLAIDLPGARVVFTTRHGGVSAGPYRSLNLGRLTEDDPDHVERNRELLASELGVRFAWIRQVHGARVVRFAGWPQAPIEADGLATTAPGTAPIVLTADCLPVAVAGPGAVAMLHAGWRGLVAGVIGEGVRALRELGASGPLAAAIGPGAGACCYEVGDEVRAQFPGYGRGRNLDLKAAAADQLSGAGVTEVLDCGICTICSEDYFSHRRDGGVTGRQAGVAWLS